VERSSSGTTFVLTNILKGRKMIRKRENKGSKHTKIRMNNECRKDENKDTR